MIADLVPRKDLLSELSIRRLKARSLDSVVEVGNSAVVRKKKTRTVQWSALPLGIRALVGHVFFFSRFPPLSLALSLSVSSG